MEHNTWISVDEITDNAGCYIGNLVIGKIWEWFNNASFALL